MDSNRNGQYDKGEKVLKGVMVSDGLNVTKTAVDGTYSLPGHSKVEFLFITTPSGYQTNYKHYYRVTMIGKDMILAFSLCIPLL